jgi:hypothetical protein
MIKLLVFNAAVTGMEKVSGEQWADISGVSNRGNLYSAVNPGLVDYDVFIVDQDTVREVESVDDVKLIQTEMIERVAGGGCVICYASERRPVWLPIDFGSRGRIVGKRFTVDNPDDPLASVLLKRESEVSFKVQLQQPQGWTAVARAMDTYPIAGYASHGSGLILMLPEFKNRAAAIRDILDNVIPRLLPSLKQHAAETLDEESPAWLGDFPIPTATALEEEMDQLDAKINALTEKREKTAGKHRELAGYQGLLWLEGHPLELVVQNALNLLGIPAEPKNPVDLACPLKKGGELYIEIEGTKGQVQVRKGRQLLGYIAEADDPAAVVGAIIGNPHRDQHPSQRPSEGGNGGPFSPQLLSLAQKQGWSLVTCIQLFDWAKRCLDGDKSAQREAREALRFG